MTKTVNVLDAIMGAGKTSAIINYINKSSEDRKFIFCTPYLKQVERVQAETNKHFVTPDDTFVAKSADIKTLIKAELNIATTHALFMRFDDEARDLIADGNYTLIIDEAMPVLQSYKVSSYDAKTITGTYCDVLEDGQLIWQERFYDGRFDDCRQDVEAGTIYKYNDSSLIQMSRIESFEVFDEVWLMTYLFDGQTQDAYFDMHGWDYRRWGVVKTDDGYWPVEGAKTENTVDYKSLITVKHDVRGSNLVTKGAAFSKSWYERHGADDAQLQMLKRHMASFFRTYGADDSSLNMWTTFNSYKAVLSGSRYAKGFLTCNIKASNDYRDRSVLAYPINRYIDPNLSNFVSARGYSVSNDTFALTEMIQWVWRSAIRDEQPICIYVPSDRMYKLFTGWLDSLEVA